MKRHPAASAIENLLARFDSISSPSVKRLAAMALGLDSLAARRDPTEPEAAHVLRISRAASKLRDAIHAARAEANGAMNAAAAQLRADLQNLTGIGNAIVVERGVEIRAHLKTLAPAERAKLIEGAMRRKDVETLNAVFEAPAFLSGLDDAMQETLREAYLHETAPQAYAAFEASQRDDEFRSTILRTVADFVAELENPQGVAAILEAQQAAQAARASFDGAGGAE
jgi:hypothetical protein